MKKMLKYGLGMLVIGSILAIMAYSMSRSGVYAKAEER